MRRAFIAASRAVFKAVYRISDKKSREDLVVFLSRQADSPSFDYCELAREFERRGLTCVMHLKKVRARNIVAYAAHVVKEIRLLGRCKIAVLDRYDPVVCLLDFACGRYKPTAGDIASKSSNRTNLSFPLKPQVLQIWHAFGAYKKFGFQSVDTPEGHSSDFTDAYDIHRNYSWVLCSGSAARPAFAEAFSCPESRVVALPRPEYDELVEARDKRARQRLGRTGPSEAAKLSALMAPTLRINTESSHPFKDLFSRRESFEADVEMNFTWSFHPLEQGLPAPGNVSDRLLEADCVVTDYSSIVYEAFVLRVPAFFYIPDIEEYRRSPGLNADPTLLCPEICAFDERELALKLKRFAEDPDSYSWESLDAFGVSGFDPDVDGLPGTAASRIVDFALRQLEGDES